MAKISPVAAKYIIHSTIFIEGVINQRDASFVMANRRPFRERFRIARITAIGKNWSH